MKKFLFLALFLLSGCGTLLHEEQQKIFIDSQPSGVKIYHNGKLVGTTPCDIMLERGRYSTRLLAKSEGYHNQFISLDSTVSSGGILDIVSAVASISGTTGITTDIANESFWEYMPNQFYIDMVKIGEKKETNRLTMFVTKNYDKLQTEAVSEEGETLDALSALTKMSVPKLVPIIRSTTYPSELVKYLEP